MIGRIVLYCIGIHAAFDSRNLQTVIWLTVSGSIIGAFVLLLDHSLNDDRKIKRTMIAGLLIPGIVLLSVNLNMIPYGIEITDIFIRTAGDVIAVTAGMMLLPVYFRNNSSSGKSDFNRRFIYV
jgi:hypothetical protein